MPASSLFIHGKLTRRLFLIFLASSLLPVGILSYIAVARISDATDQQVNRVLENEVRNFSYLILERLDFAEQTLNMYRGELVPLRANAAEPAAEIYAAQKGLLVAPQRLDFFPRGKLQAARQHLADARSLIVAREEGKLHPQIYLAAALRPTETEDGLVTVKLTHDYILGKRDTRDLGIDTCILDPEQAILYATRLVLCEKFIAAGAGKLAHAGKIVFDADTRYFSRYRGLFLADKFGVSNWKIVIIQPESEIFLATAVFRKNFILAALGTMLSLSLLSIYLIRTRMAPLAAIMAGIRRVSEKHYDQAVDVSSGDEFEELADALNSMSNQVSRQLVSMASMAEIDQLILTRIKKEDIIWVVLEKTDEVIPSDSIGLVILGEEGAAGRLYQFGNRGANFSTSDITLSGRLRELTGADLTWLSADDPEGPDLLALFPGKIGSLLLLPVVREQQLVALIVLAYEQRRELEADVSATAKSYASRIAVALANAEWEEKLFQQAHYDTLTGLPNRLSLLDRLKRSTEQARRNSESFAVLFIDMDDFKLVNDSLGHHAGDEMIAIMARRLQSSLRSGDTVARMGGDEFVLISSAFDSNERTASAMSRVANKVMEALAMPLVIQGREIRSSSSIGIAIFPRDGCDPDTLLKSADTAMYHAKSEGRGNFQFFSERLNAESVALMRLSSDIKRALQNNEFELHYQPKVSLRGQEIEGAEALLRWHHPERGLVPPGEFIEVAERMGLITAIGHWTLRETCRQIFAWLEAGKEVPRISVNISAIQIHQEDLAKTIAGLIETYQIDPRWLEIEIVEGVLVQDMAKTTAKLKAIRELGVKISIDDYGTGYSSLSYVRSFPVDTLKIDRCFISNICENTADRAIVTSTIVLAHNLNLQVVAEGVETAEQAALLQALDCDQMQGYFFSRPLKAKDMAALLRKSGVQHIEPA